ncbi:hypothetical protein [Spirosoma koreense]
MKQFHRLLYLRFSFLYSQPMIQPTKIRDVLVMPFGCTNQIVHKLKTGPARIPYTTNLTG